MTDSEVPICPSCVMKQPFDATILTTQHWPKCPTCAVQIEDNSLFFDNSCVAIRPCSSCMFPSGHRVRYGIGMVLIPDYVPSGAVQESRVKHIEMHKKQIHDAMVEGLDLDTITPPICKRCTRLEALGERAGVKIKHWPKCAGCATQMKYTTFPNSGTCHANSLCAECFATFDAKNKSSAAGSSILASEACDGVVKNDDYAARFNHYLELHNSFLDDMLGIMEKLEE